MGWQCVSQILGLVRGDGMRKDGKGQAKHRANAAGIVHEAFEIKDPDDGHAIPIRKSKSETYDRSRTINNRYTGFQTADDVLDALEEEAAKHPVKVQVKDKETGEIVIRERALRSDAVIGIAVIYNPPCEVARYWTQDQYDKFFNDCEEVMAQIPCCKMDKKGNPVGNEKHYLFRKENIIASAEHWDEGEQIPPHPVFTGHKHDVLIPADQNGEYHGKMIDALFLSAMVNQMFAPMMRERGWDIDDPDYTDWGKFDRDREYKSKRKAKIKEGGKPVNNYIADKRREEAEAQLEEAQAMVEQAAAVLDDANRKDEESEAKILTAEAEKRRLLEEASEAEDARDKAMEERATALSEKDQAVEAAQQAAQEKAQADADADAAYQKQQFLLMGNTVIQNEQAEVLEELKQAQEAGQAKLKQLQTEITASRKKRDNLKSEVEAAESDRDKAKAETEELRRTKVAQAEQAAQAERTRLMDEIKKEAEKKRAEAEEAAAKAVEAKRQEITEKITKDAEADRDAARAEAEELRRTKVQEAAKAAQTERERIRAEIEQEAKERRMEAESRQKELDDAIAAARETLAALQEKVKGIQDMLQEAERKAERIVDIARKTASSIRDAAQGEHGFLIEFFGNEPFIFKKGSYEGKSYLEYARAKYEQKLRKERLKTMPDSVKNAGKSQPDGPGGPTGPGT